MLGAGRPAPVLAGFHFPVVRDILTSTFTTALQKIYYNYFNFAEGKKSEEKRERSRGKRVRKRSGSEEDRKKKRRRSNKRARVRGGCLGAEGR